MRVVNWQIPPQFKEMPAVKNRNQFARYVAQLTSREICDKCVYMRYPEMERLVRTVKRKGIQVAGRGMELGAGCGLLTSAFLNVFDRIEEIYAIEIVEEYARSVMGIIGRTYIRRNATKRFIPTVGTFDNIELPSGSLDFAIELDSLHHSDDLEVTLQEVSRVLKPHGLLIAFDRSHPDSITQAEIEKMLEKEYSREFLLNNHYPLDSRLTRRENGEHEYRLREWKHAFSSAGFSKVDVFQIIPSFDFRKYLCPKPSVRGIAAGAKAALSSFFRNSRHGLIQAGKRNRTLFICCK